MKAILTVGVSGSGKTTWAEKQDDFIVISRDDVRTHLLINEDGFDATNNNIWKKWNFKNEKKVTELYWQHVERMAALNHNIILADTNLNPHRRLEMLKRLDSLGYIIEIKRFDIDYETAIKRDLWRKDSVGASIVWKQYKELYGEVYAPPKDAPKAILVDVDGTLAHMDCKRGPFEWHRVGEDRCDQVVKQVIKGFRDEHTKIIVLSGRDGCCHQQTWDWLTENEIWFDEFYMREPGDQRKDSIIKRELFDKHIRDKYNVVCVLDDRPQVVRMWTLMGLKVLACGDQLLEF